MAAEFSRVELQSSNTKEKINHSYDPHMVGKEKATREWTYRRCRKLRTLQHTQSLSRGNKHAAGTNGKKNINKENTLVGI